MKKRRRWLVMLGLSDGPYYDPTYRIYEGEKPSKTRYDGWPRNRKHCGPFDDRHIRGLLGPGFKLPLSGESVELPE